MNNLVPGEYLCQVLLLVYLLFSHQPDPYRLIILCSSEADEGFRISAKLHNSYKPVLIPHETQKYQHYLLHHYSPSPCDLAVSASHSHHEKLGFYIDDDPNVCARFMYLNLLNSSSRVCVVSSTRSGMGKSLCIRRMAQRQPLKSHITVPIHGPVVVPDTVMDLLQEYMAISVSSIMHLDIAPNVSFTEQCTGGV